MRFGTWCKKDVEDERKINYTFRMKEWDGTEHIERFTSDDKATYSMMLRLQDAWIDTIKLIDNEWCAVLYE
jgi:hypothetical protein